MRSELLVLVRSFSRRARALIGLITRSGAVEVNAWRVASASNNVNASATRDRLRVMIPMLLRLEISRLVKLKPSTNSTCSSITMNLS